MLSKKFKQYRYLGAIAPEIPESWQDIILDMLTEIDFKVKPWYMPRFFLNIISDKARLANGEVISITWDQLLFLLIGSTKITHIKQKFATLRISGKFDDTIKPIVDKTISKCNNTCEFCGAPDTVHVMVKSWVRNLCEKCIEENKK